MAAGAALLTAATPVLLVGEGNLYHGDKLVALAKRGWPVVAADGGMKACVDLGLRPEMVIGDGDSIDPALVKKLDLRHHIIAEQDTTDFEKCLYSVKAPLFVAFGFTGKRLDHTLATLSVMGKHDNRERVLLIDEVDLIMVTDKAVELSLTIGARLSVVPLRPSRFIASRGLRYPLDGVTLELGQRVGTSNEATKRKVAIEPAPDALFALILAHRWLDLWLAPFSREEVH